MVRILDMPVSEGQKEELITIWQESFGDDRAYIERFIKKNASYMKVVVCEENERILSVAYLLPISYVGNNETTQECYYLYAAATHLNERGHGYFSQILQFVNERIEQPVILVPASKELADYYKRYGYNVWLEEQTSMLGNVDFDLAKEVDSETYFNYRNDCLRMPGSMLWGYEMIAYISEEHIAAGGKFMIVSFQNEKLLVMALPEKDTYKLVEVLCNNKAFRMTPIVLSNKVLEVQGEAYFNLSMG